MFPESYWTERISWMYWMDAEFRTVPGRMQAARETGFRQHVQQVKGGTPITESTAIVSLFHSLHLHIETMETMEQFNNFINRRKFKQLGIFFIIQKEDRF